MKRGISILMCCLIYTFTYAQFEDWGFDDCNNPWVLCNTDTEGEKKPKDDTQEEEEEDDDWRIETIRDPWAEDPPKDDPPKNDPPKDNPPIADPPKHDNSDLKNWSYIGETEKNIKIKNVQLNKKIHIKDGRNKVNLKKKWSKEKIGSKRKVTLSSGNTYTFVLKARIDHNLNTKEIYEVSYEVKWKDKAGRIQFSPLYLRVFKDEIIAYTKG